MQEIELLSALNEFVVPRPGMKVKDRRNGRYASVEFFQWKGGETTHIPIHYDDGSTDSVWVTAFNRRYEVIDPTSYEYKEYQRRTDIEKELKLKREKFDEVFRIINGLERGC